MVNMYAMGSLLPLSNSRVGLKLLFRARIFERKMENTAAASVEDTIEPSRRASNMVKSVMAQTKTPNDTAVKKTPRVEREIPCHRIGFTDFQFVSKPPENKMKFKATIPMNCAMEGSSNSIPPTPSLPASIPTSRNNNRVGTPNL